MPTAWKQGDGLDDPTWRKAPLPGEQQGSAGKALARGTQTLLPSLSLMSDSRAAGDVPPGGVPMGAPPKDQVSSPEGSGGTEGSASISRVFITALRSVM